MQFNFSGSLSERQIIEIIKDSIVKSHPDIDRDDILIGFTHCQQQDTTEYSIHFSLDDSGNYLIKKKL